MMLGVFTAYLLRTKKKEIFKFWCLLCSGIITLIAGLIWGKWFMIDKTLYTSSTVLFTGGASMILLSLFYLIIDIWGLRKWAFVFVVIGMNSIFAYVIIHFVNFGQIGDNIVSGLYKWVGTWDDFIKNLIGFAVLWLVMYYMYRNKTFLKV
jgi:predicted acyltransferase